MRLSVPQPSKTRLMLLIGVILTYVTRKFQDISQERLF